MWGCVRGVSESQRGCERSEGLLFSGHRKKPLGVITIYKSSSKTEYVSNPTFQLFLIGEIELEPLLKHGIRGFVGRQGLELNL